MTASAETSDALAVDVSFSNDSLSVVLDDEGDETFEANAETEAMLVQAIAQCDRGQTTPLSEVLSELRSLE